MAINAFDWPWAKQLYGMQWNYPYNLNVAQVPSTMNDVEQTQFVEQAQQMTEIPAAATPAMPGIVNTLKPYMGIVALVIVGIVAYKVFIK